MPSLKQGVTFGLAMAITFVLIASLFPVAIEDVANASVDPNTSDANVSPQDDDWTPLAATFWELVQFAIPLAAFLYAIGWAMDIF